MTRSSRVARRSAASWWSARSRRRRRSSGEIRTAERYRTRGRRPAPHPEGAHVAQHALHAERLGEWSRSWLEQLDGQVAAHTFKDYRSHVRRIVQRLGERKLDETTPGDVIGLRDACPREKLRDRTVRNRLGVLRMLYRDARLSGLVASIPLDMPLPRRRTKQQRRELQSKRVTFRPLDAAQPGRLAAVLRYDSFLAPTNWPDELERHRLARFHGWRDVAPLQHPTARTPLKQQGPTRQPRIGPRKPGAPSMTRTCDLQVRNLTLYPTELWARGTPAI